MTHPTLLNVLRLIKENYMKNKEVVYLTIDGRELDMRQPFTRNPKKEPVSARLQTVVNKAVAAQYILGKGAK